MKPGAHGVKISVRERAKCGPVIRAKPSGRSINTQRAHLAPNSLVLPALETCDHRGYDVASRHSLQRYEVIHHQARETPLFLHFPGSSGIGMPRGFGRLAGR